MVQKFSTKIFKAILSNNVYIPFEMKKQRWTYDHNKQFAQFQQSEYEMRVRKVHYQLKLKFDLPSDHS